jgi:hypothetical protein
MIALRPIGARAETQGLTMACLGLTGLFALSWTLVTSRRSTESSEPG